MTLRTRQKAHTLGETDKRHFVSKLAAEEVVKQAYLQATGNLDIGPGLPSWIYSCWTFYEKKTDRSV